MKVVNSSSVITGAMLAFGICLLSPQFNQAQQVEQVATIGQCIEVASHPGGERQQVPDPESFHSEIVNFEKHIIEAAKNRNTTESLAWSDALRIAYRMVSTENKPDGVVSNFPVRRYTMVISAKPPRISAIKKTIIEWARSNVTVDQIVASWNDRHSTMINIQATIFQMSPDQLDDFKRALAENNVKTDSTQSGPVTTFGTSVDRESLKQIAEKVSVDLVSAPQMVTLIGHPARIMTGAEIPMITQKVGEVELKHLGTKMEVAPVYPLDDPYQLKLNVTLHDQLLLDKPNPDKIQPGFWTRGIQTSFNAAKDQTVMLVYESKDVSDPQQPADTADDVVKAIFFTANRVTQTSLRRR